MEIVSNIKKQIVNIPFYIMVVFIMLHLSVYIRFEIGELQLQLSPMNQFGSLGYICAVYVWALLINKKTYIKVTSLLMGTLSICGFIISLPDMGNSLNDLLFAGTSVLTVFYVFENAEYLLGLVKKMDTFLTATIWSFVVFSVILFAFFPEEQHQWGEGTYFYGHRYASVCSLVIMLIGLKLSNRPRHSALYWALLLLVYYVCFWTGARVYVLSNLGQVYALLFVFRRNNKDFIVKCVAVTLAALLAFFTSSSVTKIENIVDSTSQKLEQKEAENIEVNKSYEWMNAISNGRWEIWENCIQSYQELPLFNKLVGSGNKYIYDHNVLPGGQKVYAHTDFINILHFSGLIGLVVYLMVFVGYVLIYWRSRKLHIVLLIGFWGIWFVLALLNGYGNYMANMMSLPYVSVLANFEKEWNKKRVSQRM